MKFKAIKKIHQGEYIARYDIEYETESGNSKIYEMISRDRNINSLSDLCGGKTDAVVMILHDKHNDKILLNHEFRMAVGEWVYNFPAGLIDSGETVQQAAKRELFEETGLDLCSIDDIWNESYSAVGFSNEMCKVVVGTAEGEIRHSDSEMEEIEAVWLDRDEIRELLKTDRFAARTQAYCVLWSRQKDNRRNADA